MEVLGDASPEDPVTSGPLEKKLADNQMKLKGEESLSLQSPAEASPKDSYSAGLVYSRARIINGRVGAAVPTVGYEHRSARGRGGLADRVDRVESSSTALPSNFNTAEYDHFDENPFLSAATDPLSTFSVDVDTASYANVRRMINSGDKPPKDAVRIEEMINYFTYDYPQPQPNEPFSITLDATACPWQPEHRLVRIGLKGREIADDKRGASNLVFLLDVSGSMEPVERLPLIKQSMRLLVDKLTENDHVAIVVYAGASGVALPSTRGDHKEEIIRALENLRAGGSTNGANDFLLVIAARRRQRNS
jgi:hypothetical protein